MTVDGYKMAGQGIQLQQLEFSMASKQSVVCAILLCIVYTFTSGSANSGDQQKPIPVMLKGKVVCHGCRSEDDKLLGTSYYTISGATVAVECNGGINRKMNGGQVSVRGETDISGEFKVELPRSIIASILLSDDDHSSTLKGYCSARLLSSPQDKCNVPSSFGSSSDHLIFTSDDSGIRTFTFPSLFYHPQSQLCPHTDITILSANRESLQARRALHELGTRSSNDLDALFSHENLHPLPKSKLGFPPLNLLHSPSRPLWNFAHFHASVPPLLAGIPASGSSNDKNALIPHENLPPLSQSKLGFLPLPIPHPPPQPFFNFPPLPVSIPPLPASIPPLPAGIPFPWPPPFASAFPSRFHAQP